MNLSNMLQFLLFLIFYQYTFVLSSIINMLRKEKAERYIWE